MSRQPNVDFDIVEKELRKRRFGVLSTVARDGRSHSTGVVYGVSPPSKSIQVYVTTRTSNKKVRNIRVNPNVSFVVPLSRRVLTFIPPSCIQFQGTAQVLEFSNQEATQVFQSSYFLRLILRTESEIVAKGGGEACFVRITPDPVIFTYGLGVQPWNLRAEAHGAVSRVSVPRDRLISNRMEKVLER